MKDIKKYIQLTRGCTQPLEENNEKCQNSIYDTMHTFDWSDKIKTVNQNNKLLVEVRFKNGRKGIFLNQEELFLKTGDVVAVEAVSGHDIGIVGLQGETINWQLKKYEKNSNNSYPKIYRKARPVDLEKWQDSISKEPKVLRRTREIIEELLLDMKLGDIEFQGDGSKATFYYTADDRVDFRELIKVLASEFRIRIEMRQIGARQESSRIGGIGTCGRELCCISWKRSFASVTTNAARHQELSLNPTKLAGQCGKLKCCLNYELDAYIEARHDFPDTSIPLKTKNGNAYFQKSDVFKKVLWYSFDPENSVNITPLTINRVQEIIEMNKKREYPETLTQNNLELADLISSKHNVQITSEEIEKSKQTKEDKKFHRKRSSDRRRNYHAEKRKNNDRKNINDKRNTNDRKNVNDKRNANDRKNVNDKRNANDRKNVNDKKNYNDRKNVNDKKNYNDRKKYNDKKNTRDKKEYTERKKTDIKRNYNNDKRKFNNTKNSK